METVLTYYFLGIILCTLLGVFLSLFIFRGLKKIVSHIVPHPTTKFLSSFIRFTFIGTAIVGCLSVKFYGCQYRYDELIDNPVSLTFKVASQLEGTMHYLLIYLVIFLSIYGIFYILSQKKLRNHE